ncbi:hypothetical protein I2I05_13150 [Hymenobacter sp. BT683]|uniref:Lipocalin-like domain-containing protein n=1 Tax=Hymenobacter jeongseonensis TaxID=2791027 RepID=A0ABS0IJ32_9BACT|nr:hypothetical protein [Hymenobacter jeongseonensis]
MHSYTWLLLTVLALATACKKTRTTADLTIAKLEGIWLISHEENKGDTLVYRPQTYPFPPARGRTGFAIKSYGRFEQFDIAPTDGLIGRPGAWTLDRKIYLHIRLTQGQDPSYTLQILELDSVNQILKVRRLPENE